MALSAGSSRSTTIEHKYPIGALVMAGGPYTNDPVRPARVTAHEPYRGRAGYYVAYLDATEQWHCHSGWKREHDLTPSETEKGGAAR